MNKGQGLPITTVVLIILAVAVLAVVVIFFLAGAGSGQSSVNAFQCQQMCQTINVAIKSGQVCTLTAFNKMGTAVSYCNNKCQDKSPCALPEGKYCGGDPSGWTILGTSTVGGKAQCINCPLNVPTTKDCGT